MYENRVIATTTTGEAVEMFAGSRHSCESATERIAASLGGKYVAVRWEVCTDGAWIIRSEFEF